MNRSSLGFPSLCALLLVGAGCGCRFTADTQDDTSADTSDDTGPVSTQGDVLILTNTAYGCVRFLDYQTTEQLAEICFSELLPELCDEILPSGWARCQAFSVLYDPVTEPESLIMVFARQGDEPEDLLPGGVVAMDLAWPLEPSWRLHEVDLPASHPRSAECEEVHQRLGPDGIPEMGEGVERECYTVFPHELGWMPGHELLALSDTTLNRVIWFAPPQGDTHGAVTAVLEPEVTSVGVHDRTLNCLELVEHDDRVMLLNSFKTSVAPEAAGLDQGRLMMWDVTDLDAISHLWTYPSQGYLAAVHGPSMWDTPIGPLLTYAHSAGGSDEDRGHYGSVGLALASWDNDPVYLGDILPVETDYADPMGFTRDVKLVSGDLERLLVLDSGCESPGPNGCERDARLLEMDLVLPDIPGLSGAFSAEHEQQVFNRVPVQRHIAEAGDLLFPFEVQQLSAAEVGPGLRAFLDQGQARARRSDGSSPPAGRGVTP